MMQNEDHPLIQAMNRPNKKMPMTAREMLSADLPDYQVGDAVELSVLGVVKSKQDGKAVVEVQKVEEDLDDEETGEQEPLMVLPPESPAPS